MLAGDSIMLSRTTARAESRLEQLASISAADVVAIDAPLLPKGDTRVRVCEQVFAGGRFQRRCKPGFSHVRGTGLQLREAGDLAAVQLSGITSTRELVSRPPLVRKPYNIVEAFPNAFLGVCVPETAYLQMPVLKRGRKFDWLYDTWRQLGTFPTLYLQLRDILPESFVGECDRTGDHEKRAALICLATAACVFSGEYTAVGEPAGGYFFLPPRHMWSNWAKHELDRVQSMDTVEVYPLPARSTSA